jgi:hypothetical protein
MFYACTAYHTVQHKKRWKRRVGLRRNNDLFNYMVGIDMLKMGFTIYHGPNTWCPVRKRDVPRNPSCGPGC